MTDTELRKAMYEKLEEMEEDDFIEIIEKLNDYEVDKYDVFRVEDFDDKFDASDVVGCDFSDFTLNEEYYVIEDDVTFYSFDDYKDFYDLDTVIDDLLDDFVEIEIIQMLGLKELEYELRYGCYRTENMDKDDMLAFMLDNKIITKEIYDFCDCYSFVDCEGCLNILYGETGYRTFDQYAAYHFDDGKYVL